MAALTSMTNLNELFSLADSNSDHGQDFQFSCSTPIRQDDENDQISLDDEVPSSLAEFEENEKKAAECTSSSTIMNSSTTPPNKLNNLVADLRICFNYDPLVESSSPLSPSFDTKLLADDDTGLGARLESEILKRVQCERQIEELNRSLCDLRQQLALALDCEKKRQIFARKMDADLNKVNLINRIFESLDWFKFGLNFKISDEWRCKETEMESRIKKAGQEKQDLLKTQAKLIMV